MAPVVKETRGRKRKVPEDADDLSPHPTTLVTPGAVFVWGEGDCGQLGTGPDLQGNYRPVPLASLAKNVVQVKCGGMHSCALLQDGTVFTWGVNDECALGRETDDDGSTVPGKVVGIGTQGGNKVVQVSCGDSHTAFLLRDGAVWGCGTYRDENGPMGFQKDIKIQPLPKLILQADPLDRVVKIVSGVDHTVSLHRKGKVLTWGSGTQGQLGRVGERVSVRQRTATFLEPHAIKLPRGSGKAVDIAAGYYATFIITDNDKVYACGLNNYGQLGRAPGLPYYKYTLMPELSGKKVRALSTGPQHTLALLEGGKVLSFGGKTYGRLGREIAAVVDATPEQEASAMPGPIPSEAFDGAVMQVGAGIGISGAICAGRVYTWGCNVSYQNAKGEDDDDELKPRKLAETKKYNAHEALQLDFGGQHAMLLARPKSA